MGIKTRAYPKKDKLDKEIDKRVEEFNKKHQIHTAKTSRLNTECTVITDKAPRTTKSTKSKTPQRATKRPRDKSSIFTKKDDAIEIYSTKYKDKSVNKANLSMMENVPSKYKQKSVNKP